MNRITIDDTISLDGVSDIVKDVSEKGELTQRYFYGEVTRNRVGNHTTLRTDNMLTRLLEEYNCAYEKTLAWERMPMYKRIVRYFK